MNNGRKDNRSSRIGRLYHRRLSFLTEEKQKKINNLKRGRSNPSFAFEQGGQNEPVREDRRQSPFCA